jgi:CheY-like chemotaxis protein
MSVVVFQILAALICLIIAIVLTVPALFDFWRRWRENRQMSAMLSAQQAAPMSPFTERRVEKISSMENVQKDSLGWSDEAAGQTEDASGGSVLGREKSILVADDDPIVVMSLSRRLQRLGYTVLRSPDAVHALMGAIKTKPDLIILDVNMPSGNGLAVCEMMASDPKYTNIPVIIHSVIADEAVKQRCRQLGAHHVEKSPRSWNEIKSLVQELLEAKPEKKPEGEPEKELSENTPASANIASDDLLRIFSSPMSDTMIARSKAIDTDDMQRVAVVEHKPLLVLCIDDDPVVARSIAMRLQPYGIKVKQADNGTQGYLMAASEKPDMILLDLKMPNGGGDYVLGKLKENHYTKDIPVIVLTIDKTQGVRRRMTSLGAESYQSKPIQWHELFAEMGRCIQLPEQLLLDYDLPEQLTVQQV